MLTRVRRAAPERQSIGSASSSGFCIDGTADVDWQLGDLLGRGSSAEVWLATDDGGSTFALKSVRPELRARAGARRLLRREREHLAAARHPSIVRCFGLTSIGGVEALVLEYLEGGDLVSLLGSAPRHWLPALRDVYRALVHLHGVGLVHGDIKARNVLFDGRGRARLIDFAAAREPDAGFTDGSRWTRAGECVAFAELVWELLAGGMRTGGSSERPMLAPGVDASLRPLARVAEATLRARGAGSGSLSAFEDVIESALVAQQPSD
jgi:serine/threonine protein kinase